MGVVESGCTRSDLRFTAIVYADTTLREDGEPNSELLRFDDKDWEADSDPYWCSDCCLDFRRYETALEHLHEVAA